MPEENNYTVSSSEDKIGVEVQDNAVSKGFKKVRGGGGAIVLIVML